MRNPGWMALAWAVVPTLALASGAPVKGDVQVTVVNPVTDPVNVQVVAATPVPVTVSSAPSTTINGTVRVQDVDSPARHAWQVALSPDAQSYVVPSDQALTIEQVDILCYTPSAQPPPPAYPVTIEAAPRGGVGQHYAVATFAYSLATKDLYAVGARVRYYAGPGSTVRIYDPACFVTLTGFLLPG